MNTFARHLMWARYALGVGLVTSCVQLEPKTDFDKARQLVETSTGRAEVYDPSQPVLTDDELGAVLDAGLTIDEALRLALVNSRDLQADFQEIGIAHTDWVQSQLLANPTLDLLARFPSGGRRGALEAAVGVELLQLWRIPARAEAAQMALNATVLRIARRAGERLAEARAAYYAAVAAGELEQVAAENVDLATRSFEAVRDLHAAGAADAFDENLARGPLLTSELALRTAQIKSANAKRELAKQLSLHRPLEELALTDPLPLPAESPVDPEQLVQLALESRLDLQALATTISALEERLRFEERKAWGDAALGPSIERQAVSGPTLRGASASLTLPIFDQNQAQVARAGFEHTQARQLLESAQVAAAQDARASADRVNAASRNLSFYTQELLPQVERSLELARESYSAGRTTLLALLEVQRQLLSARRDHVTLRLEAALASSELERVAGRAQGIAHP